MSTVSLEKNLQRAAAARVVAWLDARARKKLVKTIAKILRKKTRVILAANAKDVRLCAAEDPMRDRLLLTHERITMIADDLEHAQLSRLYTKALRAAFKRAQEPAQ